jgi:acetolactate synthase small subunit
MKRIKQIIEALKVLSRTPSTSIADAWQSVSNVMLHEVKPENERLTQAWNLVNACMGAVVDIASDSEKVAAKGEGEAAK